MTSTSVEYDHNETRLTPELRELFTGYEDYVGWVKYFHCSMEDGNIDDEDIRRDISAIPDDDWISRKVGALLLYITPGDRLEIGGFARDYWS